VFTLGVNEAKTDVDAGLYYVPSGLVAVDDSFQFWHDTTDNDSIDSVLDNDSGSSLTAELVDDVAHGTLSLNSDGTFTYTPPAAFVAFTTFTYRAVDDSSNYSNVAIVTIEVENDWPDAQDDSYSVLHDQTLQVPDYEGVLANDTDDDSLTAVLKDDVVHGTLELYSDGSFDYTPDATYVGPDGFTYWAYDGAAYVAASVTIDVQNTAPVASNDGAYTVQHEDSLSVTELNGVLANDSDNDSDTLTAVLVQDVSYGTLTLYQDGSFDYAPQNPGVSSDSFTYQAFDGAEYSNTATVTIHITPQGVEDTYSIDVNEELSPQVGVLANDSGGSLTAQLVSDVSNGTLNLNSDGTFTYTPDWDYEGDDTFVYRAVDNQQGESDDVTVWIYIGPEFLTLNLPPVASSVDFSPRDAVTIEDVQGLLPWAIAQWEAIGADGALLRETLAGVEVRIHDLPDSRLGAALPGLILIDVDAAGYGWFVDPTPWESLEFARLVAPTELQAESGTSAFGRVDLLTVLTHEIGHVLGLPDLPVTVAQHHIMTEFIGLGTRRTVTPLSRAADFDLTQSNADAAAAKDAFFADLDGLVRKFYGDHDRRPDLGFIGQRQGDSPRQFADVVDALLAEWTR
jgi:VCBS repeat-containing protein